MNTATIRRSLAAALLALSLCLVGATPAAAFTATVQEFPSGVSALIAEGDGSDETFVLRDFANGQVTVTGSSAAQTGPGCTANGSVATCTVTFSTSNYTVRGAGGRDTITVESTTQSATIEGGDGDDTLQLVRSAGRPGGFAAAARGGAGDDVVLGSPGADSLRGDAGDDVVAGFAGDDRVDGGTGGDLFSGGQGTDEATYLAGNFQTPRTIPITVVSGDGVCNDGSSQDAVTGTRPAPPAGIDSSCSPNGGAAERDEVLGDFETIVATDGPDAVVGSSSDEVITGLSGADQLEGGAGRDALIGAGTVQGSTLANDDDTLFLRDNLVDRTSLCGGGTGDRAVADPEDPVDPDCETVERGGAGVTGPGSNGAIFPGAGGTVGGEPEPGVPPADPQPIELPPPTPNAPPTGTETGATGPGGGDDGETPPELRIVGQTLPIDAKRRAQARVACVYRAKDCVGTATLTAAKNLKSGKLELKRGEEVGDARVKIPWGRSEAVAIKVSRDLAKLLEREGRTKLTLAVAARDGGAGRGAAVAKAKRKLIASLAD